MVYRCGGGEPCSSPVDATAAAASDAVSEILKKHWMRTTTMTTERRSSGLKAAGVFDSGVLAPAMATMMTAAVGLRQDGKQAASLPIAIFLFFVPAPVTFSLFFFSRFMIAFILFVRTCLYNVSLLPLFILIVILVLFVSMDQDSLVFCIVIIGDWNQRKERR